MNTKQQQMKEQNKKIEECKKLRKESLSLLCASLDDLGHPKLSSLATDIVRLEYLIGITSMMQELGTSIPLTMKSLDKAEQNLIAQLKKVDF